MRPGLFFGAALSLACAGGETNGSAPSPPVSQASSVAPAPTETRAKVIEPERLEVDADGHAITVWHKSAEAPLDVIVLVHGRTWSGRPDFDLQVEGEQRSTMDALVAEGFAVYAVDQRGYGATPRDDTEWLTPDRAEKDLGMVLQAVKKRHPSLPPPNLLGWSLGALVSQLTAQRHGDLLSTVVLYGYPRDPERTYDGDPAKLPPPEKRKTTAKAAAEDFIVDGAISKAGIDAFVAQALAADPVRMDWRGGDQWNALAPEQVTVPTLVMHGERDPYAPENNQAKLFLRLGAADRAWVVLPGCDHAAHLERCGPRFVHAVVQFVRRPR